MNPFAFKVLFVCLVCNLEQFQVVFLRLCSMAHKCLKNYLTKESSLINQMQTLPVVYCLGLLKYALPSVVSVRMEE